jgi:lipoprotein-anchoring transpeptidase ErfK/SrfK
MTAPRDTVASVPKPEVVAAAASTPPSPRRRRSVARAGAIVVLVAAGAAAAGIVVASLQEGDSQPRAAAPDLAGIVAGLPDAPASALDVRAPARLDRTGRATATWAPLLRPTIARRAPSRSAESVARIPASTPEGTTNIVQVLGRRQDGAGALWIRVRAELPGGATAWIPRSAIGSLRQVRTRLVVDRTKWTATLQRDGRVVLRVPVAVGGPATPTPGGSFYVRSRLEGYADPAYGPIAFGTSALNEAGLVGIHGTDRPESVPGATSAGSIVLRNADVLRLARRMPIGTPVTVR